MTRQDSWVASANTPDTDFPLNNLPYGVFATPETEPRCGVAIGDQILDMAAAEAAGLIILGDAPMFDVPYWNEVMEAGPALWTALRNRLTALLAAGAPEAEAVAPLLVAQADAILHLPFVVAEYTDFYASRHHATNVGTMFRGAENALPPNWLHMPIGYNGRASSVVVSGTDIRRPWGQCRDVPTDAPRFAPSARFDFELEVGAIVGCASDAPLSVDDAHAAIFGYVLLNDWSARDIQAWEYQPLGPFQGKATATTISPWIVPQAALAPFAVPTPPRDVPLLPHLQDTKPMLYDIALEVTFKPAGRTAQTLTQTNYSALYFSAAQQLAHHSSCGCPMTPGDLLGSGTISGAEPQSWGSLLERSWNGRDPVPLDDGITRCFIEDGDTIGMTGHAQGKDYRIGFGPCVGTVLPALADPYAR